MTTAVWVVPWVSTPRMTSDLRSAMVMTAPRSHSDGEHHRPGRRTGHSGSWRRLLSGHVRPTGRCAPEPRARRQFNDKAPASHTQGQPHAGPRHPQQTMSVTPLVQDRRMAICDLCDQEMTEAASCTVEVLHLGGVPHRVIPYGSEPRGRATR